MARSVKGKKATKTSKAKKARKAAPAKKPVTADVSAHTMALAMDTGPVTLDEAEAIVQAQAPMLAARAASATAAPPASPAAVGTEREKLKQEQRDERARRVREYKATMDIMKQRGARRPLSAGASRGADATAAEIDVFEPLQIFAEGDSWFEYPVPLFGGGIIKRLQRRLGVPILNLAKAGDEVRFMLGVEERLVLTKHLSEGCPSGGPWEVLLFSGGGNDIVDNPMALWVREFDPAVPPADLIHQARFATAMALVRAGYEDVIALRDTLSPTTHLVFHSYDFAIPDGSDICGYGPWLKPTFDLRGFPSALATRQAVVKAMLEQFAAMLAALASQARPSTVTCIKTQGTLAPQSSSWHNELHPSSAGFDTFADIFRAKLRELFPERVA